MWENRYRPFIGERVRDRLAVSSELLHSGKCIDLVLGWSFGLVNFWSDDKISVFSSTQPSIPPESVNEYQLRLGRQRQVWLIPTADERVGVQVKLWNPLRTRAIPERFCSGDSLRRGAISSVWTFTFVDMNSLFVCQSDWRCSPKHRLMPTPIIRGGGMINCLSQEVVNLLLEPAKERVRRSHVCVQKRPYFSEPQMLTGTGHYRIA